MSQEKMEKRKKKSEEIQERLPQVGGSLYPPSKDASPGRCVGMPCRGGAERRLAVPAQPQDSLLLP